MKRILLLGSLFAFGCGIRGAPRPPQPETPPELPPGGTTSPATRPTERGPFRPAPAPDAGTSLTPPPDAGQAADAGTP